MRREVEALPGIQTYPGLCSLMCRILQGVGGFVKPLSGFGDVPQTVGIEDVDALATDLDQTISLQIVEDLSSGLAIGADRFCEILVGQTSDGVAVLDRKSVV